MIAPSKRWSNRNLVAGAFAAACVCSLAGCACAIHGNGGANAAAKPHRSPTPMHVDAVRVATVSNPDATMHAQAHAAPGSPTIADAQAHTHFVFDGVDEVDNLHQVSFAQDGADFDPDVSPDGRFLVFASTQHSHTPSLYIKSINGRTLSKLTNDPSSSVMPTFSPDGQRVAFASDRNGWWDVYVMSTSGGQPIQITADPSHQLHPTWSPDGRRLAYCRLNPVSGRWELWVVDVANPSVNRFIGHGMLPSWNPINDKIAFQRPRERGARLFSIWTIDYIEGEGRNPTEIVSDPGVAYINPSWSADGTRLVFAAIRDHGAEHVESARPVASELWMVRVDGLELARLAGSPFVNLMPTWGPDGRVYFVSDRGGADNIWSLTPSRAVLTAGLNDSIGRTGVAQREPMKKEPPKPQQTKTPTLSEILAGVSGSTGENDD